QEDSLDTISGKLDEMNNIVLGLQANISEKQKKISELEDGVRTKDSENDPLKVKVFDFTTFQNLCVQVKNLQNENEYLKLSFEELTKACELVEITLRQRDELVSA
ncbi:hypothetical protein Tco_0022283, partial [Tanacetum coccineum]